MKTSGDLREGSDLIQSINLPFRFKWVSVVSCLVSLLEIRFLFFFSSLLLEGREQLPSYTLETWPTGFDARTEITRDHPGHPAVLMVYIYKGGDHLKHWLGLPHVRYVSLKLCAVSWTLEFRSFRVYLLKSQILCSHIEQEEQ